MPLKVIIPKAVDNNWIAQGFDFLDGQYDAVLGYRHYLKGKWEKSQGIIYEFGGLAGEFYKNGFCQPFRWLGKRKNADLFYNAFLRSNLQSLSWVGEKVKSAESENYKELYRTAQKADSERTLLEKGNSVGFDILAWKASAITNGYASIATKIDPLMDRQICGYSSHDNCISHSMFRWQRKQIAKDCRDISNIPTDQGYTCSLNPLYYTIDTIKKGLFYLDRVFNRVCRSLGLSSNSKAQRFWDDDYSAARETEEWGQALNVLYERGIIEGEEDKIPLNATGWLLTLGILFRHY